MGDPEGNGKGGFLIFDQDLKVNLLDPACGLLFLTAGSSACTAPLLHYSKHALQFLHQEHLMSIDRTSAHASRALTKAMQVFSTQ